MGQELPCGWAYTTIEGLISSDGLFKDGDWVESKDQDPNGSVRLIQLADIGDGCFVNKSSRFLTSQKAKELNCTFLKRGDILVARMPDPLGRACIFPLEGEGKYVTVVDVCIIRTGSVEIDRNFLMFLINSTDIRSKISALQSGSTRKRISRKNLSKVELPIAPLNEQKRIVAKIEELFSELDNGIAALKTAREKLKLYRQAVLKHAFEGKLTAQWREENKDKLETPEQLLARIQKEREARYQQQLEEWKAAVKAWEEKGKEGKKPGKPTLPKDSELDADLAPITLWELPLGWRWFKLCALFQKSPQNGLYKPASYYGSGCQIIRIDDFYDGSIVNSKKIKRLSVTDDEICAYGLQIGDLIINRVNSIEYLGKSALVRKLNEPTVFESNIMRCSLIGGSVSNEYVTLYLNSVSGRKELCKNAKHAVNQASINQTDVGNAFVPLCSIEEQKLIVQEVSRKVDAIDRTLIDIDLQLRKAETLRQSILKKAFSGQLVPQDPNDEPASELLARIQSEKISDQNTKNSRRKKSQK
jgi:type I restriction enzyme S subunit